MRRGSWVEGRWEHGDAIFKLNAFVLLYGSFSVDAELFTKEEWCQYVNPQCLRPACNAERYQSFALYFYDAFCQYH